MFWSAVGGDLWAHVPGPGHRLAPHRVVVQDCRPGQPHHPQHGQGLPSHQGGSLSGFMVYKEQVLNIYLKFV